MFGGLKAMAKNERGNVLFIVLIGIVMFGALSFAVRGSNTSRLKVDKEQEVLLIAGVMQYAQNIQAAVTNLRLTGCSDTQISFDSTETGTTYDNPFAPASGKCNVFASLGGPIQYKTPDTRLLDSAQSAQPLYGTYFVTGQTGMTGLGVSNPCGATLSAGRELVLYVPYVKREVCEAIAKKTTGLDTGNISPQDNNLAFDNRPGLTRPFKGVYTADCGFDLIENNNPPLLEHKMTGCFQGATLPSAGTYHFFQVLLVR